MWESIIYDCTLGFAGLININLNYRLEEYSVKIIPRIRGDYWLSGIKLKYSGEHEYLQGGGLC